MQFHCRTGQLSCDKGCFRNIGAPVFSTRRGEFRNGFNQQAAPTSKFFEIVGIALRDAVICPRFDENAILEIEVLLQFPIEPVKSGP
jgi:hypothetical protein